MQPLTDATRQFFAQIPLRETDRLHVDLNDDGTKFVCNIDQPSPWQPDTSCPPSAAASRNFVCRIPERKKLVGVCKWEFATTDFTATMIHHHWPNAQLNFEAEAKVVFEYLLGTSASHDVNVQLVAEYKANKIVPAHAFDLHTVHTLSLYQQIALICSMRSEGYALFMEQGTGKTPIVIARICNEAKNVTGRLYKCLVVCPKGVRLNWEAEVQKFATTPGKVTVIRGTEIQRTKLLIEAFAKDPTCKFTLIVCSYKSLCASWSALKMVQWDLSVLDESHYIKSTETERYKTTMQLRDRSDKRMVLTGTPIANSWLDLYAQFEFLGKGWSGFNSWKNFRSFYGNWKPTESGHSILIGAKNIPFMQERLARQSFIIRKEEALPDLPDKLYDVHEVEMIKDQETAYVEIRKNLMIEIAKDMENAEHKALIINNILTKLLRLAQITSGFITWDAQYSDEGDLIKPKQIEAFQPNPKIQALVDILKEKGPNDKTIVWACWRQDIKAITERFTAENINHVVYQGATDDAARKAAEHNFNHDTECKVFVGNPAAGGTGINLLGYPPGDESYETNCSHQIYYSQNWSSIARAQSEDRPHRRGTRVQVRITDLCVPQTIDEEIRTRVMSKRIAALEISDISSILKNVLKRIDA